ncbi:hypothetical protein K439DRAFT_1519202 [Ramaria rubella]|nr:hypothetical protein K439DRAFT_1519202 [Ramaria rubella]
MPVASRMKCHVTHISVFQNPHINTVDDGDCSIILLAAIAVALQVHSRAVSSHVIHHRYPPFTVGRKSINGEYSRLEVENAEDKLVHKTEVNTLMKTVIERMPLNVRFKMIQAKAKSSAVAKWWHMYGIDFGMFRHPPLDAGGSASNYKNCPNALDQASFQSISPLALVFELVTHPMSMIQENWHIWISRAQMRVELSEIKIPTGQMQCRWNRMRLYITSDEEHSPVAQVSVGGMLTYTLYIPDAAKTLMVMATFSSSSLTIRDDMSESADYPWVYLWVFQSLEALPASGVASGAWISGSAGVDHRKISENPQVIEVPGHGLAWACGSINAWISARPTSGAYPWEMDIQIHRCNTHGFPMDGSVKNLWKAQFGGVEVNCSHSIHEKPLETGDFS